MKRRRLIRPYRDWPRRQWEEDSPFGRALMEDEQVKGQPSPLEIEEAGPVQVHWLYTGTGQEDP
jgi:hypothetical protein